MWDAEKGKLFEREREREKPFLRYREKTQKKLKSNLFGKSTHLQLKKKF